jgi:hypothetical protein
VHGFGCERVEEPSAGAPTQTSRAGDSPLGALGLEPHLRICRSNHASDRTSGHRVGVGRVEYRRRADCSCRAARRASTSARCTADRWSVVEANRESARKPRATFTILAGTQGRGEGTYLRYCVANHERAPRDSSLGHERLERVSELAHHLARDTLPRGHEFVLKTAHVNT